MSDQPGEQKKVQAAFALDLNQFSRVGSSFALFSPKPRPEPALYHHVEASASFRRRDSVCLDTPQEFSSSNLDVFPKAPG